MFVNILPKKFIFSLVSKKIVKKFPHIFHFQKRKIFKIALFEKKLSRLAFFWEKLQNCTF